MARNSTLLQLRTDVGDQADISGAIGASSRYTPTALNRLINESIQRFRERLSGEGATHFLVSATGSLGVGATSPYPFYVLDLSALSPSLVRTYGIDITVNGIVYSLNHTPFAERASFGGPQNTSVPSAWMHFTTNKVAILPPPSSGYTYVVWYLPVLADLSGDSDTYDGIAGWEQYIVWDVVVRIIVKDSYPQAYALATQERDRWWSDILRNATRVSSAGGAVLGRDSFGARGILGRGSRILPPP